jgi:hypothetical protein
VRLRRGLLSVGIYDPSLNISPTHPTFEIVRKQQGSVGSIFCCSSASITTRSLSTTILSIFPLPTRLSDLSGSNRNQLRPFGALISHRPARRPLFKAFRDDRSFRKVHDRYVQNYTNTSSIQTAAATFWRNIRNRRVRFPFGPGSRDRFQAFISVLLLAKFTY